MQKPLLDTNIILSGKEKGYVCYPVLKELDNMKVYSDALGKQARDRIYEIYSNPLDYPFVYKEQKEGETVDDFLIRLCKEDDYILHTLDLSLFLKAKQQKVEAKFNGEQSEDYSGVTYLSDEEAAVLFEDEIQTGGDTKCYYASYPDNHYLVTGTKAFKVYKNNATEIKYKSFDSEHVGTVKPRNIEQYCLLDALFSNVPVVMATGKFGSGKSFLMLSYALEKLENEEIAKLIVVPNNSFVSDSREIAAVPGNLLDKEFMHLGPLIDILGRIRVEEYVEKDRIELLPIAIARGRNLENCIVWVS
jgi:predicted ribonuclease YlaK